MNKYKLENIYMGAIPKDEDIIKYLTNFSIKNNIQCASFQMIGSVSSALLGFYNQKTQKYEHSSFNNPMEIASCIGNISLKNEEIFIHSHVVLSDSAYKTIGGHLFEGKVFACEYSILSLNGTILERKPDIATGLSLWNVTRTES